MILTRLDECQDAFLCKHKNNSFVNDLPKFIANLFNLRLDKISAGLQKLFYPVKRFLVLRRYQMIVVSVRYAHKRF